MKNSGFNLVPSVVDTRLHPSSRGSSRHRSCVSNVCSSSIRSASVWSISTVGRHVQGCMACLEAGLRRVGREGGVGGIPERSWRCRHSLHGEGATAVGGAQSYSAAGAPATRGPPPASKRTGIQRRQGREHAIRPCRLLVRNAPRVLAQSHCPDVQPLRARSAEWGQTRRRRAGVGALGLDRCGPGFPLPHRPKRPALQLPQSFPGTKPPRMAPSSPGSRRWCRWSWSRPWQSRWSLGTPRC